jgi:hypothetical protein
MRKTKQVLCGSAAALSLAWAGAAAADDQAAAPAPPSAAATPATAAAPAAPAPTPMPYPSMSSSLSANPNPAVFYAGPILGKLMVDGVLSGGGFWQSNPATDFFGRVNKDGYGDVFNGTLIVNKTDGPIQFYIQAGAYSLPALGSPYYDASRIDRHTVGFVQQGFVKFVPNSMFSIEVGALPTLIGDEYTFTFENMNIERGLLWNQENAVTKGVQVNFTKGPWTASVSWNDGFYSDRYTSASALLTYTFKNSDTLSAVAMGNYFGDVRASSFVAPASLANSQVYNLIYTHTKGPWVISPYIQYTTVPNVPGWTPSGSTIGGALLVKYSFTPTFNVGVRGEYISSSGSANLMYGPGSNAWSITVTPTYQKGIFFIRGEASYVSVGSGTPGAMFGPAGFARDQVRVLGESGVIF